MVTADLEGDAERKRQFILQVGTLSSALEHITPEQMFSSTDPNAPQPDAISSVKAMQKASAAGQRIYQIDRANMNQVLPLLSHDQETLDEIRSALNAGKDVTTHTDAVSIPGGWTGFGYIITDPVTGEGVFKISGGLNGGVLIFLGALMLVIGLFLATSTALFIAGPLLIGGVAAMIIGGFAYITGGGCSSSTSHNVSDAGMGGSMNLSTVKSKKI